MTQIQPHTLLKVFSYTSFIESCKGCLLSVRYARVQPRTSGIVLVFIKVHVVTQMQTLGTAGPIEPRHEKTGFLHMRKQRRRSASR